MVVDMVMKAPLINQTQFNGRYGCPQCYEKGEQAKVQQVWIYPYQEEQVLRSHEDWQQILKCKPEASCPIYGIRGNFGSNIF